MAGRGGAEAARRGGRAAADKAPTTADPIEIAMEAEAGDASPESPARRLLIQQEKLVRWEIADRRSGVALKVLTGAAALAVAAALGLMAWQASRADGLVVEAFSVPPDLAARGLTGQVVASQVLDRFNALQRDNEAMRPTQSSQSAWGEVARVEIPQTGVSIGELQRALRGWLGHERRVSGEVVRTADGLELTVRLGGAEADRLSGPETDTAALFDAGAKRLFMRTDPLRYAAVLARLGEWDAANAIFRRVAVEGSPADRGYALNGLGNAVQDPGEALELYLRAAQASPQAAGLGLGGAANVANALGHSERMLAYNRRGYRAMEAVRGLAQGPLLRRQYESIFANIMGDAASAYAAWMDGPDARQQNEATAHLTRARLLSALHEPGRGRAQLAPKVDDGLNTRTTGSVSVVAATLAREQGDWAEVLRQLGLAQTAADELPPGVREGRRGALLVATQVRPRRAEALAELGRFDEARTEIQATPLDCYFCLRMRGRVAALAGEAREADRWYAEAARQAPSLPQAHAEWGEALLARGDAKGAIAKLAATHETSPRFADALELWAEALLATGDAKGAAAKCAEADKLTPRWGRLHLIWGQALAKLGKASEARAEWRTAAGLDLTPADRARVTALLRGG